MLDKPPFFGYNIIRSYGGIAQLARAHGSYPWCQWFKSTYRYHCIPKHSFWDVFVLCGKIKIEAKFKSTYRYHLCTTSLIQR